MFRIVLPVLLAASLAAPALAETPSRAIHFTRDGTEYAVTVRERDGLQQISGRELTTGRVFSLRVVDGRVSGTFDGTPVSYRLAEMDGTIAPLPQLTAR